MLIFYRTFAAQRFVRHLCISKAGTFLSIHFSIFFSRNDISGQCLRGAEGESSPQSPPAGAFLLKKKTTVRDSFGQDKFAWDKFGCDKFGSILSVLVYLVFVNINFLKCLSLNINFTNVLCA